MTKTAIYLTWIFILSFLGACGSGTQNASRSDSDERVNIKPSTPVIPDDSVLAETPTVVPVVENPIKRITLSLNGEQVQVEILEDAIGFKVHAKDSVIQQKIEKAGVLEYNTHLYVSQKTTPVLLVCEWTTVYCPKNRITRVARKLEKEKVNFIGYRYYAHKTDDKAFFDAGYLSNTFILQFKPETTREAREKLLSSLSKQPLQDYKDAYMQNIEIAVRMETYELDKILRTYFKLKKSSLIQEVNFYTYSCHSQYPEVTEGNV